VALGQHVAAQHAIEVSQRIAREHHFTSIQLEGHVVLAESALDQGDRASAQREYQHAVVIPLEPDSEEVGKFQRMAAQLAHSNGNIAQSVKLLVEVEALFERLHNIPELERTRRIQSTLMEATVQEASRTRAR